MTDWTSIACKPETKEALDIPDGVSWDYWLLELKEAYDNE